MLTENIPGTVEVEPMLFDSKELFFLTTDTRRASVAGGQICTEI